MNKCHKVAGSKIYVQNSVAFLYSDKEIAEKEINKANTFTITTKDTIKYQK